MEKIYKKSLFVTLLIGGVLFTGIGVYATTKYLAKDISFTPSNTNWKVSNIEEALNQLYEKQVDDYENKVYTTSGLEIYNNRITILDGGYYIDENKTTYINITFKINASLAKNNIWCLIKGFPEMADKIIVTDTTNKYAFYIGNANTVNNSLNYFDYDGNGIEANTIITIKAKY